MQQNNNSKNNIGNDKHTNIEDNGSIYEDFSSQHEKPNNTNNINDNKTEEKSVYSSALENSYQVEENYKVKHPEDNSKNNIDNDKHTNIEDNGSIYEDFSSNKEDTANNDRTDKDINNRKKRNGRRRNNNEQYDNNSSKEKSFFGKVVDVLSKYGRRRIAYEKQKEEEERIEKEKMEKEKMEKEREAAIKAQQIGCFKKICNGVKKIFCCCCCRDKNNQTNDINNLNQINKVANQNIVNNQ